MIWQFAASAFAINYRSEPSWQTGKLLRFTSTMVTHQSEAMEADGARGCSQRNLVSDTILSPRIPPRHCLPPPPPPASPGKMQISVCFHGYRGAAAKPAAKAFFFFFTCTIVLRDNGSPRPPSYRWISRVTDGRSAKRALKHKRTHPVAICVGQ